MLLYFAANDFPLTLPPPHVYLFAITQNEYFSLFQGYAWIGGRGVSKGVIGEKMKKIKVEGGAG